MLAIIVSNVKTITTLLTLFLFNVIAIGQNLKTVEPVFELFSDFPNIRDFTISSSGLEGYITVQSPLAEISVLVRIKNINSTWIQQSILSFSGKYNDLEPFLSKNNLRLYFVSNRPIVDSINLSKNFDIWYVERESIDSGWGIPINIRAPINTEYNEFYPSIAQNNNLYFTSDNPASKGKDDIFYSIWSNNEYSEPISLNDSINTDGYEFNAYIAFDESYIIFSGYNREDGYGSGDLYISFRDENLIWCKAINLGEEINSKYMDYCPFIDSNSKTMYFTSKRSSFKKINNFKSIEEVINEINKNENGTSKVYKVPIEEKLLRAKNKRH